MGGVCLGKAQESGDTHTYTYPSPVLGTLPIFFLPAPIVATTLALVQVLAGSSGSHVGSGLKNSRNVSQLLRALQSLPVTSPVTASRAL